MLDWQGPIAETPARLIVEAFMLETALGCLAPVYPEQDASASTSADLSFFSLDASVFRHRSFDRMETRPSHRSTELVFMVFFLVSSLGLSIDPHKCGAKAVKVKIRSRQLPPQTKAHILSAPTSVVVAQKASLADGCLAGITGHRVIQIQHTE
ncbi:hypothetical protein GGI43DRAFT_202747 [Trichoderma evansii]